MTDKGLCAGPSAAARVEHTPRFGKTMPLRTMNIAPRAFLRFSLIGALMLILGLFALSQMSKICAAGDDVVQNGVPSLMDAC